LNSTDVFDAHSMLTRRSHDAHSTLTRSRSATVGSFSQETRGYTEWVKARQADDFKSFAPVLNEWVELKKERAAMVNPTGKPYDTLADDFSAGLTAERITEIFDAVKGELIPFLADLRENGKAPDNSWLVQGDYDVEKQTSLCFDIAKELGFDMDKGLLNVSVHPFTGGCGPEDVRWVSTSTRALARPSDSLRSLVLLRATLRFVRSPV
jgi:Zn-dependent M32 family carboxypeptidase